MQTTKNHGLVKPELTDPADITQLNQNWEKIDENLPNKSLCVVTIQANARDGDIGDYTYSSDKSYNEILAAHENGQTIIGVIDYNNGEVMTLSNCVISSVKHSNTVVSAVRFSTFQQFDGHYNFQHFDITEKYGVIYTSDTLPSYGMGTSDYTPGQTPLETGKLHFVFE